MTVQNLLKRELDFFPDMNQDVYWNLCKKYGFVKGVAYSVLPIQRKGRLVGNILYRMYKFHTDANELYFVANTEVLDREVWHYAFGCCDRENWEIAKRLMARGKDHLKQSAYAMSLYQEHYQIEKHIVVEGEGFFENSLLLVLPKDVLMALRHTGYIHAKF